MFHATSCCFSSFVNGPHICVHFSSVFCGSLNLVGVELALWCFQKNKIHKNNICQRVCLLSSVLSLLRGSSVALQMFHLFAHMHYVVSFCVVFHPYVYAASSKRNFALFIGKSTFYMCSFFTVHIYLNHV